MSHGGKRQGAGRPAGAAATKTREIADRAASEGVTPLEVMLDTMRTLYAANDRAGACAIAKDAAPYCHPRLANTTLNTRRIPEMTDDELAELADSAEAAVAPEGGDSSPNGAGETTH